jgi:cell wall-associated NlpC family hydrolase
VGKPYVFGSGPNTDSFDCSDLIQWAYAQQGIELPRTTFDQIKVGKAINPNNIKGLKPGDLIFPTDHHVVMYVGGGKVIAAPHTGTVVQYQPLSRFGKLLAVRRVIE